MNDLLETTTHGGRQGAAADPTTRPLHVIALDIRINWPKVNYAAVPYLEAMEELNSIKDNYYLDTARSIVAYFLSNAHGWRGNHARRIKAELKGMMQ